VIDHARWRYHDCGDRRSHEHAARYFLLKKSESWDRGFYVSEWMLDFDRMLDRAHIGCLDQFELPAANMTDPGIPF
jgi:hypothetical protein